MPELIPAIIAKDFNELKQKLSVVEGLVSWAQIDVMDGTFVPAPSKAEGPPSSWHSPEDLDQLHAAIHLEAHLMISEPEKTIDAWLSSPVRRILVHYESAMHATIEKLLAKIDASGKEVGIALKLQTPLWVLDPLFQASRFMIHAVQFMGIAEIGYYGHGFEEKTLERVATLREKYPNVTIAVDGGVNLKNAASILRGGADNLIVGSAIFKSKDPKEEIENFKRIIDGESA